MARSCVVAVALAFLLAGSGIVWAGAADEGGGASEPVAAVTGGVYRESPMLTALVAAGELPPVDERLPLEPKVIQPLEEVGRYNERVHVFTLNNFMWGDLQEEPETGNNLIEMLPDGTIIGDIAKSVVPADDNTSITYHLREGMKWSDGHPLTADDFVFMFEDMHMHPEISTWGFRDYWKSIEKVDDYTVRIHFHGPHPEYFLNLLDFRGSGLVSFHPKHYLEKWHVNHNPNANEVAKEEGFDDWLQAFEYHYWWHPTTDIEKPTTQPWRFQEFTTTHKVFERNPYYHAVDPANQQLPYIDLVVTEILQDPELYHVKITAGEADIAFANTSIDNYSLYKQNEESGGYTVTVIPGINGSESGYAINVNHPDLVLREVYQDVRFRRALSLAIDRDEINKVAYFGLGTPRAATLNPSTSFYKPEWGEQHPYVRHAPDEANDLLDDMGLTERDRDGFRLRPDGETLLAIIEVNVGGEASTPTKVNELIREYWQAVGVKTEIKEMDAALWGERGWSHDHEIRAYQISNTQEFYAYVSQAFVFSPKSHGGSWAKAWGIWLEASEDIASGQKTLADFEGGELPGEEPPQEIKDIWQLIYHGFSNLPYQSPEYRAAGQRLWDWHAENMFIIGTIGLAPTLFIAKDNIGNIPTEYPPYFEVNLNFNKYSPQWFFRE